MIALTAARFLGDPSSVRCLLTPPRRPARFGHRAGVAPFAEWHAWSEIHANERRNRGRETRPPSPNLRAVPPAVQPLLPEARALKPTTPFVKRLAFVRTGHSDAKCLLLVLGSWCEVYTDGAAGRCWPKRETVRELCEMGSNRFKRAWRRLVECGALIVRRRGQGLSSMLTVIAVPFLEPTPGGPIKPVSERTPGGPIKTGPPVVRLSKQTSDQTREGRLNAGRPDPLSPSDREVEFAVNLAAERNLVKPEHVAFMRRELRTYPRHEVSRLIGAMKRGEANMQSIRDFVDRNRRRDGR